MGCKQGNNNIVNAECFLFYFIYLFFEKFCLICFSEEIGNGERVYNTVRLPSSLMDLIQKKVMQNLIINSFMTEAVII